ncbi:MAG TPA: hypothetical protein VFC21_07895 [Bryobacteraceae bacterium]|nr:hypothetical protein [Bryobacteraceae bacterium]
MASWLLREHVVFSRRIRVSLLAVLGIVVALGVTVAVLIYRFQPVARDYVISALRQRYKSDVELGDLRISLFPRVHATGANLILHFAGRKDLPPLVVVRKFTLDANFAGFFRSPRRISHLKLEGVEIHIPPRSERKASGSAGRSGGPEKIPFVLDEVVADGTILETLPSDPAKEPLLFNIRELTLHTVGIGEPMTFHAKLDNPKPPGFIHSDGKFGPWNAEDPSATAVSGQYTFRNADLAVFHGISGTLSSDGRYNGELARIEVQGSTDTPDFALSTADRPMPLHTDFQATVDGTNGNTLLHPVKARLGKSEFEVSGSIDRGALEKHKTILLDATGQNARLEDFLRLSVKAAKAPMTGRIGFEAKVKIPPGDIPVAERIQLDGAFSLNGVKFTSEDVERKIASLSHHAEGDPKAEDLNVAADFKGKFHLRGGELALPDLRFRVPGAVVDLRGKYALRSGDLDFQGTAKMEATVSEMTTGIKRILLKPIDPLFRRDGAGTVLPIRISGTRGQPSFSLDIGKVLRRSK